MISRILGGAALILAIGAIIKIANSIPAYFILTFLRRANEFTIPFLDNALSASSEVLSGVRVNSNLEWVKDLIRRITGHTLAPQLKLTADYSHWVCVCERFLDDQEEQIRIANRSAIHVHGRIGFPEGPQVNDPRAPENREALQRHEEWWAEIRKWLFCCQRQPRMVAQGSEKLGGLPRGAEPHGTVRPPYEGSDGKTLQSADLETRFRIHILTDSSS